MLQPSFFNAIDRMIVFRHLLGEAPVWADEFQATYREGWPEGWTDLEYFYSGLDRLLSERGWTVKAALSIRLDLEEGRIRAVVIDDESGESYPIPPQRWRASKGREELYWTGRAVVDGHRGDIYLLTVDEISALLVLPTKAAEEREAERQVETTDITDPEATPRPANAKPAGLKPRERTTVYKLILGLAAGGYSYRPTKPGERTTVISDIVGDLERRGLGLSDETIRKWLAEAYEALGGPDLD
jgi:hypothetical protein